jgi:hypothetical protein
MFRGEEIPVFFISDFLAQDPLLEKKTFVEEIDFGGGRCVDLFGRDSSGHYGHHLDSILSPISPKLPILVSFSSLEF